MPPVYRREKQHDPSVVGLPTRPFLYTLDQISQLISVPVDRLRKNGYIYFDGRTVGMLDRMLMVARNIAPPNEKPDWRVAENELIRWLRTKGFKVEDRGWVKY